MVIVTAWKFTIEFRPHRWAVQLKVDTLYSSYATEKGGYITSYWGDETQGARRKYYHITDKGRELYRQNMLNWEFTLKILNNLLKEEK